MLSFLYLLKALGSLKDNKDNKDKGWEYGGISELIIIT